MNNRKINFESPETQEIDSRIYSYCRLVEQIKSNKKYSPEKIEKELENVRRKMYFYGCESPDGRKGYILKSDLFKFLDEIISFSDVIRPHLKKWALYKFEKALYEEEQRFQMSKGEKFKKVLPVEYSDWDFHNKKLGLRLNGHYGCILESLRHFKGDEYERELFIRKKIERFKSSMGDHLNKRDKDFLMSTDKFIQFKELTGFVPE